jgi:hypothetical protein
VGGPSRSSPPPRRLQILPGGRGSSTAATSSDRHPKTPTSPIESAPGAPICTPFCGEEGCGPLSRGAAGPSGQHLRRPDRGTPGRIRGLGFSWTWSTGALPDRGRSRASSATSQGDNTWTQEASTTRTSLERNSGHRRHRGREPGGTHHVGSMTISSTPQLNGRLQLPLYPEVVYDPKPSTSPTTVGAISLRRSPETIRSPWTDKAVRLWSEAAVDWSSPTPSDRRQQTRTSRFGPGSTPADYPRLCSPSDVLRPAPQQENVLSATAPAAPTRSQGPAFPPATTRHDLEGVSREGRTSSQPFPIGLHLGSSPGGQRAHQAPGQPRPATPTTHPLPTVRSHDRLQLGDELMP